VITSVSGNKNHRSGYIEGIKTKIDRLYLETTSSMMRDYYEIYMRDSECTECHGARLNNQVLAVRINQLNIYEVTTLPIKKLLKYIAELDEVLTPNEKEIGQLVIKEIAIARSF
jgi:excinuclease ABC subunit A